MPRSFIQIKNKNPIYTISAYKNDNCKRTRKKTSEIFCYVVENNFSFNPKNFKENLEIHFLGIQGHGKGCKVKQLKNIIFHFLVTDLESLVNFH